MIRVPTQTVSLGKRPPWPGVNAGWDQTLLRVPQCWRTKMFLVSQPSTATSVRSLPDRRSVQHAEDIHIVSVVLAVCSFTAPDTAMHRQHDGKLPPFRRRATAQLQYAPA
jgi:hypothetical protein